MVPGDPGWFLPGSEFLDGDGRRFVVSSARPYRDRGLVVAFEGVTDRAAAEALRGTLLLFDPDRLPVLEEGAFWTSDLVGLEAVRPDGTSLGMVAGVVPGPQDRLVVETPGGQRVEVPFVDDLVGDPGDGRIVVDPPAGLFEEA